MSTAWIGVRPPRLGLLALLAVLLAPLAAPAQEAGRLLAVQQRRYRMNHELVVGAMFEPIDAFSKGLAPEGAYIWHMNDEWAWEVLRGGYLFRFDTGLGRQLQRDYGVAPTKFEELQYYAATSLDWSPVYGKFALRNASLIHLEALVSAGAAFGRFTNSTSAGPELGFGLRVFASQRASVRLDVRDTLFLQRSGGNLIKNVLFITLGLSVNLGGAD